MDAHGLIFACATAAEERAAKRAGLRTALVGLGGANGLPDEDVVSFGLAGALDGLETGAVIDAVKVVDTAGNVLWEGEGLGVAGAVRGTILASERVIDDPEERARLHERTGADAADLESGALAATGRLRGVLRVVSDTPERTLGGLAAAVTPQGGYDWSGLARAFAKAPRGVARAAADARRALTKLSRAAEALRP